MGGDIVGTLVSCLLSTKHWFLSICLHRTGEINVKFSNCKYRRTGRLFTNAALSVNRVFMYRLYDVELPSVSVNRIWTQQVHHPKVTYSSLSSRVTKKLFKAGNISKYIFKFWKEWLIVKMCFWILLVPEVLKLSVHNFSSVLFNGVFRLITDI